MSLHAALSADGSTPWEQLTGGQTVFVTGNFGGGTAQLQLSPDKTAIVDIASGDGGVHTANGIATVDAPGAFFRVNLNGSASPDMKVHIVGS